MNDELLSRIAETLYWTGRYVERADDTARIVDVYVHSMLGEPAARVASGCGALLGILGVASREEAALDIGTALFQLVYDPKSPSAIAGSILSARAGARGIREVMSSEMWECLNVTAHGLPAQRRTADRLGPHGYLRFVRERAALFFGLADETMSRDDAWHFLLLGRALERVDMTARLLLAGLATREEGPAPAGEGEAMVLRACGAHESFIRTHGWSARPSKATEFLLLDRLFPRSVLHTLASAEECLTALRPGPARTEAHDPARRPIGRVRTRLEYADPQTLTRQLPELLSALQRACVEANEAITALYFQYEALVAWAREG